MSLRCKLFVLLNVAISSFAQNDVCKEGLYGDNCELTCSETCRPFQTFPCDKKSGQCSEGCKVGYFGDKCDKQCDCGSRVCYQATGECIESDETTASSTKHKSDNVGSTTEIPEQSRVCDGVWRVVGLLLIVLTLVLGILLGIGIFFYVRRRTNQRTIKASDTSQRRFPGILFCFSGARDNGSKTGQEQVLLNDGNMQSSPVSTDVEAAELGENPKQTDQVAIGSSAGEKQARKSGKDIQHKGQLQQKQTENEEREKEKIIELIKQLSEQATENKELTKSNRDLEQKLSRQTTDNEKLTRRNGELEQQLIETWNNLGLPNNSTNHLLVTQKADPSNWLQCPSLKFDKETVTFKDAQIDDDNMMLWNIPDTRNFENKGKRFQHFKGATCTEPLSKTGFYQYFEALFKITLGQSLENGAVVLFLGFCEKNDRDVNPFTQGKQKLFLVKAVGCKKHNKICLVFGKDMKAENHHELMENSVEEETQVNIGIRLNKDLKRLGVFESESHKVLHKTDINIGEKIWLMFGFADKQKASVSVKLMAGSNINMSEEKKELLKPT